MDVKDLVGRWINTNVWLYLRTSKGYFYKCQLVTAHDESFTVVDRDGLIHSFQYKDIEHLNRWRDSNVRGKR